MSIQHHMKRADGEVLTELLNCEVLPYEHTLSVLERAIEEKDAIVKHLQEELNRQ